MQITRSCDADYKSFVPVSLAVTMFVLLRLAAAGQTLAAESDPSVEVNIAAGTSLEQALFDVGHKVGLQLASATYYLAGHTTPELRGRYPFTVVLTTLLQQSGLSYKIEGPFFYVRPTSRQQRYPGSAGNECVFIVLYPSERREVWTPTEIEQVWCLARDGQSAGSHYRGSIYDCGAWSGVARRFPA